MDALLGALPAAGACPGAASDVCGGQLANAQHLWSFLDELAQSSPEEYDQFIRGQLEGARKQQQAAPAPPPPDPAFCARLRTAGAPLLVNVCAHAKLKPPGSMPDGSIPIAVGVPRPCVHRGQPAHAVDVVVNPEVTERAATDASYREELAALASECAREVLTEQKLLPEPLRPGYQVLPPREARYAGAPQPFVDARAPRAGGPETGWRTGDADDPMAALGGGVPASLVQQLASMGLGGAAAGSRARGQGVPPGEGSRDAAPAADGAARGVELRLPGGGATGDGGAQREREVGPTRPLVQELSSCDAAPEEPPHELQRDADALILHVQLPRLRSAAEVAVDVGANKLSLVAEEGAYALHLELPRAVDSDAARCRFDKKRRALTITMPLSVQGPASRESGR